MKKFKIISIILFLFILFNFPIRSYALEKIDIEEADILTSFIPSVHNIWNWIEDTYNEKLDEAIKSQKIEEIKIEKRKSRNEVKEILYSLNPINSVPLYNQLDYPDTDYGNYGTVATHGCGITSLAMVASYLKDAEYKPDELASQFGNYNTEDGSYWILFEDSAKILGLNLQERTDDTNAVMAALKNGQVVVALQREGIFTSSGHFIVLVGLTSDGRIIVNDPNGANYKKDILKNGFANGFSTDEVFQCGGPYWIYAPKEAHYKEKTITLKLN